MFFSETESGVSPAVDAASENAQQNERVCGKKDVHGTLYDLRIGHILKQKGIKGNALAVYETLLLICNPQGLVTITDKRIAEYCRFSVRTAQTARTTLIKHGFIDVVVKGRSGKDGHGIPSKYRVRCKRWHADGKSYWESCKDSPYREDGCNKWDITPADDTDNKDKKSSKKHKLDRIGMIYSLLLGQEHIDSITYDFKLTLAETLLYIICTLFARNDGTFYLSLKKISRITGISKKTLIRARNGLEFFGLLIPLDTTITHDSAGSPVDEIVPKGKMRRYRIVGEYFGGLPSIKNITPNSKRANNARFLKRHPELKKLFEAAASQET